MGRKVHLALARAVCVLFSIFLGGCVETINAGLRDLDAKWERENARILQQSGTRYYKVSRDNAHRALLIALSNLGMIIEQQDSKMGFINAKANAPSPLSISEWTEVRRLEEPRAQAESGMGKLIIITPDNREIIINSFVLERSSDVQVTIRFRVSIKNPVHGLYHGSQPPPSAVRIGIRKVFDEFERVEFIQKEILTR
jgi:hypothetical protein